MIFVVIDLVGESFSSHQFDITFDKHFLEHDKERGTRQKIDEPPTPYSYYPYEGPKLCNKSVMKNSIQRSHYFKTNGAAVVTK